MLHRSNPGSPRMTRNAGRLRRIAGLALVAAAAAAPSADAGDARVLDGQGRVLTVGNFSFVPADGGGLLRIEDLTTLSWELHDADRLVGFGRVPGSELDGVDDGAVLSRDPVQGDILLAWSRQSDGGGPREIATIRFGDEPNPDSLRIVARGTDDQLEPSLIHDEAGWAYIAWIDQADRRHVKILAISPAGGILTDRDLSTGRSTDNSAPKLGIDAFGRLFVAYLGRDEAAGDAELYVLAPYAQGGGISHVPNPLIELGLQGSLPAPGSAGADPAAMTTKTDLHLTVLGGTPIGWWTETSADHRRLFHYVAPGGRGWGDTAVRTIDLSTGTLGTVPEALELLEARFRTVVNGVAVTPRLPGLPGLPGRPGPTAARAR